MSNVNSVNGYDEGEGMAGLLHTCYDIQVSTSSVIEPDCFTVHGGGGERNVLLILRGTIKQNKWTGSANKAFHIIV